MRDHHQLNSTDFRTNRLTKANILKRTYTLRFSISFLLLVGVVAARAQDVVPPTTVRVIPQPRQAIMTQATFPLGAGARIILSDQSSDEDRFAAQDFIDDARDTANVSLTIGRGRVRQAIVIGTID
jgi:hypothetical protein